MTDIETDKLSEADSQPLFYPSRKVGLGAPFRWLRLGWQDLRRARFLSLAYGIGLVFFLVLLAGLAWNGDNTVMLFTLAVALILAGPVLAFGLYSISRQLEQGKLPRFGVCWRESRDQLRNEMLFALVILIILLVWARAAAMVNIFLPMSDDMHWQDWLEFLLVGSAIGSLFASLVFCISVVSLPMMLDRDTDAIVSAISSFAAVLNNKGPLLLWAVLIVLLCLAGLVLGFVGLAVVLPWIGHASWHAYRDVIQTAA